MKCKHYHFSALDHVSLSGGGSIQAVGEGNGAALTIHLYGDQFPRIDVRKMKEDVVLTIYGDHERLALLHMLMDFYGLELKHAEETS